MKNAQQQHSHTGQLSVLAAALERVRAYSLLHLIMPALGGLLFSTPLAAAQEQLSTAIEMAAIPVNTIIPAELQGEGQWQAFKHLWQRLDQYQPHAQGTLPSQINSELIIQPVESTQGHWPSVSQYKQRAYYQVISASTANELLLELNRILGEYTAIKSIEGKFLYRLVQLRVAELTMVERRTADYEDKNTGIQLTRAMPPIGHEYVTFAISPTAYAIDAIDRLQLRANSLVQLREQGVLDEAVYRKAVDALVVDAQLALYLTSFKTGTMDPESPLDLPHILRTNAIKFSVDDFPAKDANFWAMQTWENAMRNALARSTENRAALSSQDLTPLEPHEEQLENDQVFLQQLTVLRQQLQSIEPLLLELER